MSWNDYLVAGVARCFLGIGVLIGALFPLWWATWVAAIIIILGIHSLYKAFRAWDEEPAP